MMSPKSFALPAAAAAVLVLAGGCGGPRRSPVGPPGPMVPAAADETALLRWQFAGGQVLRYSLDFRLKSDGEARTDEKLRAVIEQSCLGPVDPAAGQDGFFKLNLLRQELERSKKYRGSGGKDLFTNTVRPTEPEITPEPNTGYDRRANRTFLPCDARGMFGLTRQAPFHRVAYDSLVYLLPVLPAEPAAAGGAWQSKIPVYAGPEYFTSQGDYAGGNDFELLCNYRLERIWSQGAERFAEFSWTFAGSFDTAGSAEFRRFPPSYHERRRVLHDVKGSGRAIFNVTRGLLVTRRGKATVTFTVARLMLGGPDTKSQWVNEVTHHILDWDAQLLPDLRRPAAPGLPPPR